MANDDESQIELISRLSVPRYATRLKPTTIPTARWDDAPLYGICINDQWISHILGVLNALDQPDAWIGTKDEIYDARQQVNEIMVAFMEQCDPMSNCCPEPLTRLTDDGTMQVSYDGGMTWQDATTEDPRNTAPQMPPLPGTNGDDKRCTAANNILGQFKDGISTFDGYFDTLGTLLEFATAVAGFIAAVIFAPTAIPIVVGAIIALLSGVWSAGKTAYESAFDDEIYGKLLCIIYCHCEPDGTFTDADFSAIRADISAQFTEEIDGFFIARDAFLALLNGVSTPGLNNLAKIPTGSSASCDSCTDCNDCGCNLEAWDWDTVVLGANETFARDTDSCEITADSYFNGSSYYFCVFAEAVDCCVSTLTLVDGTITGPVFHAPCDYTGGLSAGNEAVGWVVDSLSLPHDSPFRGFLVRSTTPFTVKIVFSA